MTDEEMTVLVIASQGESMIPIGHWEKPIRDLTERGLMQKNDDVNYVITPAGREALQSAEAERGFVWKNSYVITPAGRAAIKWAEAERDGAFANALKQRRRQDDTMRVDMTVFGRRIKFDLTFDPAFVADVNTHDFLLRNGACEPEVVHLMRRVIHPGDFVIDGGANIGFFALVMSRLVGDPSTGSGGHVEAFEPSILNFKKIKSNLGFNCIENVTVLNRALWSEDMLVTLYQGVDSGSSSLMPFGESLTHIPVGGLTLDMWCLAYDQAPRLLKLDIEGAELHALIGAGKMLTRGIDFISCEMNLPALDRFGTSQMDLRDYMAGKGYSTFLLHENGDRPTMVDREQMIVPPTHNTNILFSTVEKVHEAWGAELT